MEIGKEHLASGLDSFLFLCYHALFLPILLICLSIRHDLALLLPMLPIYLSLSHDQGSIRPV